MKVFRTMQRAFCPYCSHCCALKEAKEKEEKKQAELDRWREEECAKVEMQRQQEIREGIVHGKNYDFYSESDIQKITNIAFLQELSGGIVPSGQPRNEWEWDYLNNLQATIDARIALLEK